MSLVEIRSAALAPAAVGRTVRGYAAVFNSLSESLGGFREVIRPGAFAGVLNQDVRALVNHDDNLILARSKSGTLRLREDGRGLAVEFELGDQSYAEDLRISMQRGDVTGMSFGFVVGKGGDAWRKEGGQQVREITRFASLMDVSVVTFPAYPATEAAVRDIPAAAVSRSAGVPTENLRRRLALVLR